MIQPHSCGCLFSAWFATFKCQKIHWLYSCTMTTFHSFYQLQLNPVKVVLARDTTYSQLGITSIGIVFCSCFIFSKVTTNGLWFGHCFFADFLEFSSSFRGPWFHLFMCSHSLEWILTFTCIFKKQLKRLCKNHACGIGEKITETRGLTCDFPVYNAVHFYNPTSLWALSYYTLTIIAR